MQIVEQFLAKMSDLIWGPPLLFLLMGTHLFLTFRLRFIQRYLWQAIKITFTPDKDSKGDVSHFSALMTALAATIGTGNIIGVSTAIAAGGPGAVLWMWFTGVFGIATKYAEALLSVKYRLKNERGQYSGGPMYVIEKGMNCKWLAVLFAIFTAISAFGIGNMVQANSIAILLNDTYKVQPWISGLVITTFTAVVILGGIRSIAVVCAGLVPFMALFYIAGCVLLLVWKADTLPGTICLIFRDAFRPQAAVGGFIGAGVAQVLRYGIARGLFSNESGMGSAPIVAAAAKTANPVRQALVSSTGTFWDTVVVCALTGLVVVNSGLWVNGLNGVGLTNAAFGEFHVIGRLILSVALLTFVFSTILGWSYYGEKAMEYLFGVWIVKYYRCLWVVAVMVGSTVSMKIVWSFADITNGLMAIPNLISLIVLNKVLVDETRTYLWNNKDR